MVYSHQQLVYKPVKPIDRWPWAILAILFKPFFFDFQRTWWMLFQERVVHTKFDIYVFIMTVFYFKNYLWYLH